jgi:hypothetical protein
MTYWKESGIVFLICLLTGCNTASQEKNSPLSLNDTSQINWSTHIAPIIYSACAPCHRQGQSGPFHLLSYKDALKKAKLIKFVTQTGYMPPWPADASYTHFIGERVLSEHEKWLIKAWVDNGCARGDSLTEIKAPEFSNLSFFGKPDLVVRAGEIVNIKGNGTDAFLIVKFPYQLEKDTIADFFEFVPHQRKLVHHVNGHLLSYDNNRKFNYITGKAVHQDERAKLMDVYKEMHIPYTDDQQPAFPLLTPNTVYYLPGYIPPSYPGSIGGYRLKKNGAFLLNNIHYGPSNADVTDTSYINVFFRKNPIKRPVTETQMGTFGISKIEPEFVIPPNEIKTFHTQARIEKTISLLSVNPHMHLIGKTFWAFALKQNGDTIPLIKIPKWDFRWQYYYTYLKPVIIEAGSVIHVYGKFDNTAQNPFNPFSPPQTITQGNGIESMKTTEEMFQFIFTFVPYQAGDEQVSLEREK